MILHLETINAWCHFFFLSNHTFFKRKFWEILLSFKIQNWFWKIHYTFVAKRCIFIVDNSGKTAVQIVFRWVFPSNFKYHMMTCSYSWKPLVILTIRNNRLLLMSRVLENYKSNLNVIIKHINYIPSPVITWLLFPNRNKDLYVYSYF